MDHIVAGILVLAGLLQKTRPVWLAASGVLPILAATASAADVTKLEFRQPKPHQVIQRTGLTPGYGYAEFLVRGGLPQGAEPATWEYRVVPIGEESGPASNWAPLSVQAQGTKFTAKARGTAGGWYRLEVRCRVGGDAMAVGSVEPFGIGELFLVAGQSYATNCNDERLNVKDGRGRVVAFNAANESWGIANDPQPAPDGSDGGSIWPPLGDALAHELRVPIGFANVAVGGTSSLEWMPEEQLHPRLIKAGQTLGSFRAVLWQQGETVGGMKWSADYPCFIEQTLRRAAGPNVVSIFGTGCCGDINHSDPRRRDRNKSDFIGNSIGESIRQQLGKLTPLERTELVVKSRVVRLPLQDATRDEVAHSIQILDSAKRKEKVDFLEHVTAYKKLILDELRHREPFADTAEHITWGLSQSLAGIGETLPVEVTVITLGRDVAIVTLPGEVFVELGLAIKQSSPFRTTLVIELSNCVETIYLPNRAAYAGGSYEVTNSATQPGSGEMLVEAALSLLREAATESMPVGAAKK